MKAIETTYKGYRFRSRLEARWAVFFDALGLKWAYEPEGFELGGGVRYLPDFRVEYPGRNGPERHRQWFEVKGDAETISQRDWEKLVLFNEQQGLIVLDGAPDLRMYLNPHQWLGDYDGDEPLQRPYTVQPHALKHERDGVALWCPKGRMWFDWHGNFFEGGSYFGYGGGVLERAVEAARSARFEFGQSGATV